MNELGVSFNHVAQKHFSKKIKDAFAVYVCIKLSVRIMLVRIMLMAEITQDMLMRDSFHNRSGVLVNSENVWASSYVQMYKVL